MQLPLVDNNWNYGWAIIFITIIVRMLFYRWSLHQSKKALSKRKNASNQTQSGCCTSKMETNMRVKKTNTKQNYKDL